MKRRDTLVIGFTVAGLIALVGFLGSSSIPVNSEHPVADIRNSSDCYIIRTDITMLRMSVSQGRDTPQEVIALLDAARMDFSRAALSFGGPKAQWLKDMAELSGKVRSYKISGVPEDGAKALDELFAKMNLVDQFCK